MKLNKSQRAKAPAGAPLPAPAGAGAHTPSPEGFDVGPGVFVRNDLRSDLEWFRVV